MRPAEQALVKLNWKETKDVMVPYEDPSNAVGAQEVLRFRFDTYVPKIQQVFSLKCLTK
jgi:hypothetical protein